MLFTVAGKALGEAAQRQSAHHTPSVFPSCAPQDVPNAAIGRPLSELLRPLHRPADITVDILSALNIHVIPEAALQDLIPSGSADQESYVPPHDLWMSMDAETLLATDDSTKRKLSNGNLSPGVQTYVDRQKELHIPNEAAFRTVRREKPPPGEQAARLGNAYEFYKNLEMMSLYWADTSVAQPEEEEDAVPTDLVTLPSRPSSSVLDDEPSAVDIMDVDAEMLATASSQGTTLAEGTGKTSNTQAATIDKASQIPASKFAAASPAHPGAMPAEYRTATVTSLLKLVTYDFGCNVFAARSEPRLALPNSYFPSAALFVYRTPTTRAEARGGIMEGPCLAISSRRETTFVRTPAQDNANGKSGRQGNEDVLDLAREVVAAFITAQWRAREGRCEERKSEGQWWCTRPRWGGGTGGPIGKEADRIAATLPSRTGDALTDLDVVSLDLPSPSAAKRSRRTETHYDAYRMVRPPSSTWDRKTRYAAIGKMPGVDWDDVFVVSALNHHVSMLRIRVPGSLLREFESAEVPVNGREQVQVWRSRWLDLFIADERAEAVRCIWGIMAWIMRT